MAASTTQSSSLLSLLYLALLTFVGSAVLFAEMHQHSLLRHNVHAFLTLLMVSSCIWMLWFGWHSASNKQLKMYQDHQAGASWLKGTRTTENVSIAIHWCPTVQSLFFSYKHWRVSLTMKPTNLPFQSPDIFIKGKLVITAVGLGLWHTHTLLRFNPAEGLDLPASGRFFF